MVEQIEAGLKEHRRSNTGLFISSLSAGLEVGFSILVIGIIYTLFKTEVSPGKLYLMMALVYPIGYIFVIIRSIGTFYRTYRSSYYTCT